MENNKKHTKLSTVSKNILIPLIPPAVVASIVAPIAIVYNKKSVEQEKWVVTFDECFGDSTSQTIERKVTKGETTTLYNPEHRDGHGFLGWKTVKDDGSVASEEAEFFDFANTPITGNIKLYGYWKHGVTENITSFIDVDTLSGEISIRSRAKIPANLVIPSTITVENGNEKKVVPVKSIAKRGFANCRTLKTISLPDSIEEINGLAFSSSSHLQIINMPKSLKHIGKYAFNDCQSLEEITLPEGMTSIEEDTFSGMYLDSESEQQYCFIKKLTLPSTIVDIESGAFEYSYIENIDLSKTKITILSECAFYFAVGLRQISLPDSLTEIGAYAFECCHHLQSITIPNRVEYIDDYAFQHCTSLDDVKFAENSVLISIGEKAFNECYNLTKITIPAFTQYISQYAFADTDLISVKFESTNTWYTGQEGDQVNSGEIISAEWKPSSTDYTKNAQNLLNYTNNGSIYIKGNIDKETGCRYISNNKDRCLLTYIPVEDGKMTVPATITSKDKVLKVVGIDPSNSKQKQMNSTDLYEIEFLTDEDGMNYIEYIRPYAFNDCYALQTVNFNVLTNLKYIEKYAFHNAFLTPTPAETGNINLDLSECKNLEYIGPDAFSNGSSYSSDILSIKLPSSITTLGSAAFAGDNNLENINFGDLTNLEAFEYYDYDNEPRRKVPFREVTSKTNEGGFDPGVLVLENYDFDSLTYNTKITNIDLSKSKITYLPEEAFEYTNDLVKVSLPSSLLYIGEYAFYYCQNLQTVTLPSDSKLYYIDYEAFYDCYSLSNITLPSSLSYIEYAAFEYCNIPSITIPEACYYIGANAFYGNPLATATFTGQDPKWYVFQRDDYSDAKLQDITDSKANAAFLIDDDNSTYYWYKKTTK